MTAPKIVRARRLRAESTYAERRLWDALRGGALEVRFRRQHPVGRYVVDFACVPARLAVELDGAVHERVASVALRDAERTVEIEALGWRVVRFPNAAVEADLSGVLEAIRDALRA